MYVPERNIDGEVVIHCVNGKEDENKVKGGDELDSSGVMLNVVL